MIYKVTARDVYGDNKTVEIDSNEASLPLLDELEKKGVALAYGCRAGSCGVCRIKVVEGGSCFEERGFVEDDTWARCEDDLTIRLACQATLKKESTENVIVIEPAPEIHPIE